MKGGKSVMEIIKWKNIDTKQHDKDCVCPGCYIGKTNKQLFNKWWFENRPITVLDLNDYDTYRRLYYAAMYGFDAGLNYNKGICMEVNKNG